MSTFTRPRGLLRRAVRALRGDRLQTAEHLRLLIEHAPVPLAMFDKDLRYIAASRRWLTDFRIEDQDVLGRRHYEVFPEIPERWKEIHRRCLAGEVLHADEDPFERSDGTVQWVRWETRPWRERDGSVGGIIIFSEEITARKCAELAVEEEREKYRSLFASIDEGFCVVQVLFWNETPVDYRFLEVNSAFERQTGLVDAVGKRMRDLRPGHEQHWFDTYGRIALTGKPERFEKAAAELGRWYTVYAWRHGDPARRQVAILFNDITDKKRAEDGLREAVAARTQELHRTVTELEAFSYTVSHDLRAPLRAIQGYARIVAENAIGRLEPATSGLLERISTSAIRMDQLIQDLLVYGRLSRADYQMYAVDLDVIVAQVLEQFPQSDRVAVRRPLGRVIGQDSLLTQALSNLVGNALKFVAPGRELHVEIRTERQDGRLRVLIEDNGIGIPAEYAPKLFEPFTRLHAAESYEGTGIGLAIVKRAVERMGGEVGMKPRVGHGSVFWIDLPRSDDAPAL